MALSNITYSPIYSSRMYRQTTETHYREDNEGNKTPYEVHTRHSAPDGGAGMNGSPGQSGQEGDVASVEEMTPGTIGCVGFCVYADDGDELAESAGNIRSIPTITHPSCTYIHILSHTLSHTFSHTLLPDTLSSLAQRSSFPTVYAAPARYQALLVTHSFIAYPIKTSANNTPLTTLSLITLSLSTQIQLNPFGHLA